MLKHNSYFEGQVQSVGFDRLGKKSVGVVLPGEYRFDTGAAERMHVISGEFEVRVDGQDSFRLYPAGTYFEVKGQSFFDVRVAASTAYLCEYL